MAGLIALVGGDEFRRYCVDMDREILAATGKDPARVVVLPTAAVNGPVKAAHDGVTHFKNLGGSAHPLMIMEQGQANDPEMVERLAGADVIYFTGGNPNHLLETLQGSRLLAAITEALAGGPFWRVPAPGPWSWAPKCAAPGPANG